MSMTPTAATMADAHVTRAAGKRPTGRRMPPLNALRSFEAAARHLSIVKAADELSVTPAAVSHQVKVLERFLGVSLLDRANRSLILTDVGKACLPDIHDFFKGLTDAIGMIGTIGRGGVLTVSVAPSFAAKWPEVRIISTGGQRSRMLAASSMPSMLPGMSMSVKTILMSSRDSKIRTASSALLASIASNPASSATATAVRRKTASSSTTSTIT